MEILKLLLQKFDKIPVVGFLEHLEEIHFRHLIHYYSKIFQLWN